MKFGKINNKKIKNIVKSGIVLTTVTFTLAACSKKETPEDWPEEYLYIDQEYNDFDDYCKTVIKDGKPEKVYKGENIYLTINKENYEVKEYIYNNTALFLSIYDLNTEYLLVEADILYIGSYSETNHNKIIENKYVVDFSDISDYVEGEELQEYYSLEEIKNLEPKIVESLKLIEEYDKSYQKTK